MPAHSSSGLAPPLLDSLPSLVLDRICDYLADCDGRHRHSLLSFSLASRPCYSAASSHLFRRIYTTLSGIEDISKAVKDSREILGQNRLRYVRELVVRDSGAMNQYSWPYSLETEDADYGDDGRGEPFFCQSAAADYFVAMPSGQRETQAEKHNRNQRWLPLVHYLESLSNLTDITWAHGDQIPTCIIEALGRRQMIKLHVQTFSLRGLYQRDGEQHSLDPEEHALATLPYLHTIAVRHFAYEGWGHWDYHDEAVKRLAQSTSPGLRHVVMISRHPGDTIEARDMGVRLPWRGFTASLPTPASPSAISLSRSDVSPDMRRTGNLTSLTLLGIPFFLRSLSNLMAWEQHVPFSALAKFEIHCATMGTLDFMITMARHDGFSSLDSLHFGTCQVDGDLEPGKHRDVNRLAAELLEALRPLRHLKMPAFESESVFQAVVKRHGPSLRTLHFVPEDDTKHHFFSLDQIEQISRMCRRLQGLTLPVPRTLGNASEVAIYRAIGRLPVLEHVKLFLNCTILDNTDLLTRLSQTGGPLRAGEAGEKELISLQDSLMNTAIDSTLAKSMFYTIAQSQSAETGISYEALPLYRVVLEVSPDRQEYLDIGCIHRWIGRNWVCERRSRSGWNQQDGLAELPVAAKELYQLHRLDMETNFEDDLAWVDDAEHFKNAWNKLWPPSSFEGYNGWKEAWHSLPLSE